MDENHLQLVRDALKTIEQYKADPNGFMKRLTQNQFLLENKKSIWDHFGILTSLSPTFADKYQKTVLRNYPVPQRKFWNDYVSKIEDFIYYMAQVPGERSVILDRALQSFANSGGLTPEQLAQLRATPLNQRMDAIDKLLKSKKSQKEPYYGSPNFQSGKGISGAKSPYVITTHPTATAEEHQKLQELGLEEKYEPKILTTPTGEHLSSSGTLNMGQKFLTNAEGERLNTTGPLRQPITLLGPNERLLSTGIETFQAEDSKKANIPGSQSRSMVRRILHPGPEVEENLAEAEHLGKMGLIGARANIESAVGQFAHGAQQEVSSLITPPGSEEVVVGEQEVPYGSNGSTVRVPRSIRRVRPKPGVGTAATNKAARRAEQELVTTTLKTAATRNPYFLIASLVAVVVVLIFVFGSDILHINQNTALCGLPDTPCGKTPGQQTVQTQNVVAIFKNGDQFVNPGADISYNITVTYTGPGVADLELTDTVPTGTTFKSYSPVSASSSMVGNTITWDLNNVPSNTPQIFFLTVTAPNQNVWVQNTAIVKVLRTSITNFQNTAPNQNNCNGTWGPNSYFGRFPQNGNFGDPNCDFSLDSLINLLRLLDPINADYWFNTVIRIESGWDPNAYLGASTSGKGAYGLFQMNPCGRGNDPFDCGNTIWQLQTQNAITYEQELANCKFRPAGPWMYWASAYPRWVACP